MCVYGGGKIQTRLKSGRANIILLWDAPLYAVNMFYYHWLIKKLLWPMAGQNIAKWEIQAEIRAERRWSQGDAMEQEVNHKPCGKYKIIETG